MDSQSPYTAFTGSSLLFSGTLKAMLQHVKAYLDKTSNAQVLIFEDQTGKQVDFNFQGTLSDVIERVLPPEAPIGPGRPKLGVVSREITLLPRHWEWLEQQPRGISAALRKLVDEAKKNEPNKELARRTREAAYKFMMAIAGNLPHFEEASRALFAKNDSLVETLVREWPEDIRKHLMRQLRESAFLESAGK